MILFVLFMLAISLVISRRLFRSLLVPLGVFTIVWGISLSILWIETLVYYPLNGTTWALIFGAWLSFLLGSVSVGLPRGAVSRKWRTQTALALPRNYPIWVACFGVLALLGTARFIDIIVGVVGLVGWQIDPLGLRWGLTQGGRVQTGLITYVFQGVNMAAAALGGVWAVRRPRFLPAYFPLLAAVLFDMFYLGRAHTIIVCVIFLSAVVLSGPGGKSLHPQVNKRRYALILLALLFLVGVPYAYISSIRAPLEGAKGLGALSRAVMPYIENLSQNWYLVDDVMQTHEARTWGANIFFPEAMVLYRLKVLSDDPRLDLLYSTPREVGGGARPNTYTLVGMAYADFGVMGVLALLYGLGFVMNWVFIRYQTDRRLWHVVALAFANAEILFSVQGDQLGSPAFNVGLLVGIALAMWIQSARGRVVDRKALVGAARGPLPIPSSRVAHLGR